MRSSTCVSLALAVALWPAATAAQEGDQAREIDELRQQVRELRETVRALQKAVEAQGLAPAAAARSDKQDEVVRTREREQVGVPAPAETKTSPGALGCSRNSYRRPQRVSVIPIDGLKFVFGLVMRSTSPSAKRTLRSSKPTRGSPPVGSLQKPRYPP